MQCTIIAQLLLVLSGIIFLITERIYKMQILRKHQYLNVIKIIIFVSTVSSYVPIKLSKVVRSIHLFKSTGGLRRKTFRNILWDILEIDWKEVTLTLNGNVVNFNRLSGHSFQR